METICRVISDGRFAILDNNKKEGDKRSYIFSDPVDFHVAATPEEVEAKLTEIERSVQFGHHAVGYFSYELGHALNRRVHHCLPQERSVPLFCVGIYRNRVEVADDVLEEALEHLTAQDDACIANCQLNMSKEQYLERLGKVKQHIYDGDTYQVNYTLKYKFNHAGSAAKLYTELRRRQRVEYGAYLDFPGITVLSRSPELFFNKKGEDIFTKPMKGTSKRGATPEEDRANFEFLSTDEKSRAENVMIVDLLRNDFSRISHRGTVRTTGLFEVQTYETLHQMVSTVSAKIDADIPLLRLMKEIFPCGSITGAPKLRTMEIIRELEMEPRGIYTGAIGYIAPDKTMCFSVAIRTLVLWPDGSGEMGVGSGVVHDSDTEAEYEECCLKGQFFTRGFSEFQLIESLRYDKGYSNLERHIERLQNSAAELGFKLDPVLLRKELLERGRELGVPSKVRVLLSKNGKYAIECLPIGPANGDARKIILSPHRVQSKHGSLLRHKTSLRTLYQRTHQNFSKNGYYDVIFTNERGEITEGTFNNLFIRKDGRWYTPPVCCGLLPGIRRQCLLESTDLDVSEKVLTIDDLKAADEICLTNDVRGMVTVQLELIEE
jgi:para-aminobenzoate synthetase/4-amino-4-deoxychorismate lyase